MCVGIGNVPRVTDDAGPGLRCPGLYEHLMRSRCLVEVLDPRILLELDADQWPAVLQEGRRRAEVLVRERAGEPVSAALWEVVGGQHGLPRDLVPDGWDAEEEFVVCPDDIIRAG